MASSAPDDDLPREALANAFRVTYGLMELASDDLDCALCHRSYAFEQNLDHDNERLEFLGDAVIGAIASEYLYENNAAAREGELSKLRARMVSRTMLGKRGLEMGLGPLIRLGRGEDDTGGRTRESNIGSALEAIVGVIYLRLGYAAARRFTWSGILVPMGALLDAPLAIADYKSPLQEWTQRHLRAVPTYTRLTAQGPDHEKEFEVQVSVVGTVLAQATGPRIKTAENEAARLALDRIERGEVTFPDAAGS